MADIFDAILTKGVRAGKIPGRSQDARTWFRQQARRAKTSPSQVIRASSQTLMNRQAVGQMYFFQYDPKWKKTLPYYDTFPLIFPIGPAKGGFMGINFHYLPLPLRAKLMDALYNLTNNTKFDESTRLKISLNILQSTARFKWYKPTVKHYLRQHLRSRFLLINSSEWDTALFLPVARFKKGSVSDVYADSKRIINS